MEENWYLLLACLFVLFYYSLELLDKTDAPSVPDGYGLSVAFASLLDVVKCVSGIVTSEMDAEERRIRALNKDKNGVEKPAGEAKKENGVLSDVDKGNLKE